MDRLTAIETSLEIAAARIGDPAGEVYRRLFARHPAMEAEFWRDRSGAIRGEMLTRTFEVVMDLAGAAAWGEAFLATEVVTHDNYGIPRGVFADFLPVVAGVIADACGAEFTDAMRSAWDDVLARAAVGSEA